MILPARLLVSFLLLVVALFGVPPGGASAADDQSVIGGTVYRDRDYDGKPQGNQGIRGIQVNLRGSNRRERTTTDSKGGYTFDDLPSGEYTITIALPDGDEITTATSLRVKVDGRSTNRVIDFGVAPARPTPTPTRTPAASPTVTPTATPTVSSADIDDPARLAALNARSRAMNTPVATVGTITPTPTPTSQGGRGGTPDLDARLRAASLEPLRYATGRERMSAVKRWSSGDTLWLGVPFRTQIDGSYFSLVNCGPASLAMVLGAFGLDVDPPSVREYVNFLSGNLDPDSGTSLDHISRVAREAGLLTLDLYGGRGYRAWDLDLVRYHISQGHPVITLARYQSLPGNSRSMADTDHYVVITGLSGDDFIYNDAAFSSSTGYGLLISGPDLERAWEFSSNPRHGVAVALEGAPEVPPWIRSHAAVNPVNQEPVADSEAEVGPGVDPGPDVVVAGDEPIRFLDDTALALALLDQIAAPRLRGPDEPSIRESAELSTPAPHAMVSIPLSDASAVAPTPRSGLDPIVLMLLPIILGLIASPELRRKSTSIWRLPRRRR